MNKLLDTLVSNVNSETNETVWWVLIITGSIALACAIFGAGVIAGRLN